MNTIARLIQLHGETYAAFSASIDRHDDPLHPVVYALCREQKTLLRQIVMACPCTIEEARLKASYIIEGAIDGLGCVEDNDWTGDLLRSFLSAPLEVAEDPDAALLALGKQMEGLWKIEAVVNLPGAVMDDEVGEICGRTEAVVKQIIATPCRTIDGVRTKLRAYLWCRDEPLRGDTTEARVIASLFRDLGVSTAPTRRAA